MAADDTHSIASRYAKALFSLASSAAVLDAAEKDMGSLKAVFAASAELSQALSAPLLPRAAKAKIIDAVLEKSKAHDLTRKFARQLALAGRIKALPAVIAEFESLMLEHRGEVVLDVVTAAPLSDADAQALAQAYGKKAQLRRHVDPSLIGGMVVQAGGKRMDYSLKTRLARLGRALKTQAA